MLFHSLLAITVPLVLCSDPTPPAYDSISFPDKTTNTESLIDQPPPDYFHAVGEHVLDDHPFHPYTLRGPPPCRFCTRCHERVASLTDGPVGVSLQPHCSEQQPIEQAVESVDRSCCGRQASGCTTFSCNCDESDKVRVRNCACGIIIVGGILWCGCCGCVGCPP